MKVSVVIPVFNEASSIGPLLEALLAQTLPPDEIVITDAGSSDNTKEIISDYVHRGAPVRLVSSGRALPGRARNLAASQAHNEWLALIDAGTFPEKNWLESLVARAPEADVVYGTYEPVTDSLFKVCAAISYIAPSYYYEGTLIRPTSVASALIKRSVWDSVGGFPEHLRSAEDLLFMQKIEGARFTIARAPHAKVNWQLKASVWSTFTRLTSYARNNMRAGLWSQWQRPVFERYGLLLLSCLPALFLGMWWLLVSVALWLALLGARAIVNLRRNRVCYPANLITYIKRFLVLVPLLALIDAATFLGTLQWLIVDSFSTDDETASVRNGA